MNYYLIIILSCFILPLSKWWQKSKSIARIANPYRWTLIILSVAILTLGLSQFLPMIACPIVSSIAIFSIDKFFARSLINYRKSNLKLTLIGIASILAIALLWMIPGLPELGKLILSAILACVGVTVLMRGWIRLRAWVMVGIMLSTLIGSFQLQSVPAVAATEVIPTGAYIIDMGQATQTIATGLKPYGLVYELVVKKAIPVKWAIDPNKVRDGADFTANGKPYKGGSFIIPPEYATDAATTVNAWKAQGVVVDGPLTTSFNAPIYDTITNFPNAVLDFANGSIAQSYYTNAGIPASTTGTFGSFTTYRSGTPSSLNTCDDIYVMPHADPTWANHSNLIPFVQSRGFVWAACHSVSVLERVDDPSDGDTLPDMNFLSHVPPATQDSKSLKLFGTHALPTLGPYQYATSSGTNLPYGNGNSNLAAYPIMQFLGKIDTATQNGSEQVYIPDVTAQWRNETAVAVYDQNNTDPVVLNTPAPPASQVKAAKMAFGPAFGNSNNGMVMYEAGHSHAKAALPDNIAAQRAFFNFILLSGLVRGIRVNVDLPPAIAPGSTVNLATSNNGNSAVTLSGGSGIFSYQWYSSCGGTFSNPNTQNPTFTAPVSGGSCTLRVVVKDSCNRRSFGADTTTLPVKLDVDITKNDNVTQVYSGQTTSYTITVKNNGTVPIAGVQISDRAFNGNPNGTVWSSATPSTGIGNDLNLNVSTATDPFYGQLEKSTYSSDELLVSNVSLGSFKNSSGTVVTKIDLRNANESLNIYNWTGLNLAPGQSATLTLTGTAAKGTGEFYIANFITVQPLDATNNLLVDTDPTNNRYYDADRIVTTPNKTPDLKITKSHSPAVPKPGDAITYTITLQNISTDDDATADVVFTDLVAASINVTGWSCAVTNGGRDGTKTSCGVTTSGTGNNISYGATPAILGMKLSKADNGKITTLTFTVNGTVTNNIGNGTIVNTATIAPQSSEGDINTSNNTANDSFTIPTTDLEITKSDGQDSAIAGVDVTYQIRVKNNGPNTVTSFNLQEVLPPELTLRTPVVTHISSGNFAYNTTNNQGSWTGLNLLSGESITLSLNTELKPDAVGTLQGGKYIFTNTVQILTTGITGLDRNNNPVTLVETNSANNSSSDVDELLYQADLSVVKSNGVSFGKQNDTRTYTIKVTNNGPSTVKDILIVDRATKNSLTATNFGIPSQGSLTPANPSFVYDAVIDKDKATLNWSNINLASGQSATVTLTANVAMANGNLSNLAIVSPPANFTDTNPGNNQSEDVDGISPIPPTVDLVVKKTNNLTAVAPGQVVTYEILVINKSSIAVDNIKVLDIIPPDLIDSTLFATSGDYDPATGLWTNIYLEPNGDDVNPENTPESVVKLILEGTVKNPPTQSKLTNTATVDAPTDLKALETNTSNNTAIDEDNYPVASSPNLLLVKRITAINGDRTKNPNDNTPLNVYQDYTIGAEASGDNHPNWPTPINTNSSLGDNISTFLQGAIDGGKVKPEDEIEYTIYYLNAGDGDAKNVKICDVVLDNMTFVSHSYAEGFGMNMALHGTTLPTINNKNLSNTIGDDEGDFYPPSTNPAVVNLCKKHDANNPNNLIPLNSSNNLSGAVLINLNTPIPNATGSGTPPNSYGFVRFRAKVK
jgi:uncharacterized repeat protein (TIGR01451 family)